MFRGEGVGKNSGPGRGEAAEERGSAEQRASVVQVEGRSSEVPRAQGMEQS